MEEEFFTKVEILGVNIGKASGWDHSDIEEIMYYDFTPNEDFKWDFNDITFNWATGLFKAFDDDGELIYSINCIEAFNKGE